MNPNYIINDLRKNKFVFVELLENSDSDLVIWKPSPDKWCLLEIVCHLYDEEREDFRDRIKNTLENPDQELSNIDPAGWVTTRKYMNQDFNSKLNEFLDEREKSVHFLLQLHEPKWENYYKHPKFGNMTAKMFFTNWLAHDYLHIRQIIKLKFDYLSHITGEKLNYAGDW